MPVYCEHSYPFNSECPACELIKARAELSDLRRRGDHLAYACARQVCANRIDSRSAIGDSLLSYLQIGNIGGHMDVPSWMAEHEARMGKDGV